MSGKRFFKLQPIKNEEEKFKKRENLGGEIQLLFFTTSLFVTSGM